MDGGGCPPGGGGASGSWWPWPRLCQELPTQELAGVLWPTWRRFDPSSSPSAKACCFHCQLGENICQKVKRPTTNEHAEKRFVLDTVLSNREAGIPSKIAAAICSSIATPASQHSGFSLNCRRKLFSSTAPRERHLA